MALKILYRGTNNSIPVADATCFTQANYGENTYGNDTLSVNTPRGVLGGSVAAISSGADYTAFPGTDALRPIGLFVNDAAGAAFENAPAVASGKVAIIKGKASVEVDVYETYKSTGAATDFSVGTKLYCSAQGLLTNEVAGEGTVIGIVTKEPTLASATLGLEMSL
jgi:hypothetical protein